MDDGGRLRKSVENRQRFGLILRIRQRGRFVAVRADVEVCPKSGDTSDSFGTATALTGLRLDVSSDGNVDVVRLGRVLNRASRARKLRRGIPFRCDDPAFIKSAH